MARPPKARGRRAKLPPVITVDRARQLAALTYASAADWSERGFLSAAEWQGYLAAYRRGADGWAPAPGTWDEKPPEVESVAAAITKAISVRKGRLFDEPGLDDPAPWADYGTGSLSMGEVIALRRHLRDGQQRRLRATGWDRADELARDLDDLFDDLLHERAGWLRPTPAAVEEAARAIRLAAVAADAVAGPSAPGGAGYAAGELAGDTAYAAAVAALEVFGDAAARHQHATEALEAQLTIHGLDRDAALMSHVRALQQAAFEATARAAAALSVLRSRHGPGQEYHASHRDAAETAFRQAG